MTHRRRLIASASWSCIRRRGTRSVWDPLDAWRRCRSELRSERWSAMCRDESGGAVPGATVTAHEVRTNISRTAVSNEAGNYTFTNLASGVYRVEGELVGFRKFTP